MPRIQRTDIGGYVYHILNRANARVQIFDNDEDYRLFESILEEGVKKFNMRILAYCIMPNHWHLVLYPKKDGDLAKFMGWITNTHTRRWHIDKETVGQGHLYQGRYKSFIVQEDSHFLTLIRYVERNALKARLVRKAQNWKWSSVWRRENGTKKQKKLVSTWPVVRPVNYLSWINTSQSEKEDHIIDTSIKKSIPFGGDEWISKIVKKFGLEQTLRGVGRPKKDLL